VLCVFESGSLSHTDKPFFLLCYVCYESASVSHTDVPFFLLRCVCLSQVVYPILISRSSCCAMSVIESASVSHTDVPFFLACCVFESANISHSDVPFFLLCVSLMGQVGNRIAIDCSSCYIYK
jgi:hypothetical protein